MNSTDRSTVRVRTTTDLLALIPFLLGFQPTASLVLLAVAAAFGLSERPDPKKLAVLAEAWSPWRSVAARLFWAYYAVKLGRGLLPVA